jgi:hypothetical protein
VQKALYIVLVPWWIWIHNHWNPSHHPSSPPRQHANAHAESTVQEGSLKTVVPFGAFIFTGGASELAGNDDRSQPSRLAVVSRHRRLLSSQGEWIEFLTSLRCRRWKPCGVWWTWAPVTAYSSEPPLRAGCAAAIAPPPPAESPRAVHLGINDLD